MDSDIRIGWPRITSAGHDAQVTAIDAALGSGVTDATTDVPGAAQLGSDW
jgi:hypothetical protein